MFGVMKLMFVILTSHIVYDFMKEDRQKWVAEIRRVASKKWHEFEESRKRQTDGVAR